MTQQEEFIVFECPHCGQTIEAPVVMGGSTVTCPKAGCSRSIHVPGLRHVPVSGQPEETASGSDGKGRMRIALLAGGIGAAVVAVLLCILVPRLLRKPGAAPGTAISAGSSATGRPPAAVASTKPGSIKPAAVAAGPRKPDEPPPEWLDPVLDDIWQTESTTPKVGGNDVKIEDNNAQVPPPSSIPAPKTGDLTQEQVRKVRDATVLITTPGGMGSGFFVAKDGYLLTSYHVIAGADRATVKTYDGKEFPVEFVAAYSGGRDLALVKINADNCPFLEVEDKDDLELNDPVFIIGHPHGHTWTFSKGFLAGKREVNAVPVIQFSADISPGNSGGPVVDADAKVRGIATYIEQPVLRFANGRYMVDPSKVLKFGVASKSLAQLIKEQKRGRYSLSDLVVQREKAENANIAMAAIATTHALLMELRKGLKDLKVGQVPARSGGPPVVSIYNVEQFVRASVAFKALTALMDQRVPTATGDENVDTACRSWRLSVDEALHSVGSVVAAEGRPYSAAAQMSTRAKAHFNQCVIQLAVSVGRARKAIDACREHLANPIVPLEQMDEITKLYTENYSSLKL